MKWNKVLILIIMQLFFSFNHCEIFSFDNYKLNPNYVSISKKFVFEKNPTNSTKNSSGIEISLNLTRSLNDENKNDKFYLYLVDAQRLNFIDITSQKSICCSRVGGIICNEKMNTSSEFSLSNYSIFEYSTKLDFKLKPVNEEKYLDNEGTYYTVLMVCSKSFNSSDSESKIPLAINGEIKYFNYNGFLSGNLKNSQFIYISLILVLIVTLIFWIYKLSNQELVKYQTHKYFTIALSCLLFQYIMDLNYLNQISLIGSYSVLLEIFQLLFSLIKNLTILITLINISEGHIVQITNKNNLSGHHSERVINLFTILNFVYYYIYIIDKQRKTRTTLLDLSCFLYYGMIFYSFQFILKKIESNLLEFKEANDIKNKNFFEKIYNILLLDILLTVSYFGAAVMYKYNEIWQLKFLVELLNESIMFSMIVGLTFIIYPKPPVKQLQLSEIFEEDVDLNDFKIQEI